MAFLDKSKANYAFKALLGKAHTSNGREFANEAIASGIILSASRIFADTINSTPTDPSNSGIVSAEVILTLEAVAGSDTQTIGTYQAYRTKLGGSVPASLVGKINPLTNAIYAANDYVGNIIPQSFGDNYRPKLYSDSSATVEIPPSSSADWFFDCYAGIVVQEGYDDGSAFILGSNGRIRAYIYTGRFVSDALTSGGGGGGSGSSEWLDSAKGFSQDLVGGTNAFYHFFKDTALTSQIDTSLLLNGLRWVHIGSTVSGLNIYNPTTNQFSTGSISNNDVVEYYVSQGTSGTVGYIKTTPTNGTFISFDADLISIFRFTGSTWVTQDFGSTASNGLTKVGNDIQLGGALTSATTITGANNDFTITGVDDMSLSSNATMSITSGSTFDITAQTDLTLLGLGNSALYGNGNVTLGAGNNTFVLDNSGIIATLNGSNTFRYAADYSANFVTRSIVDKGYVDNKVYQAGTNGVATASNGLTLVGQDVQLGGALASDTTITYNSNTTSFKVRNNQNSSFVYLTSPASNETRVELQAGNIFGDPAPTITIDSREDGSGGIFMQTINGGSIRIADGDSSNNVLADNRSSGSAHGFEYAADYSTDYTNRSLVDKQYVDNKFYQAGTAGVATASNGLTKVGQDVQLGGTLTSSITIDGNSSTYDLTIQNLNSYFLTANGISQMTFSAGMQLAVSGTYGLQIAIADATSVPISGSAIGFSGLEYTTDYSANFSARSLVDKAYVDSIAAGLDPKESVRATTTANITLSGLQTIDGVSLVNGDRVLVKDQTAGENNGIYIVHSGAWTRSTDFDGTPDNEVTAGAYTFVTEGTLYASTGWVLSTADPITLDTTPLVFVQFSAAGVINANNGLTQVGTNIQLGGTLLSNTTISGASSYDLSLSNLNNFTVGTSVFTLTNSPNFSTAGYDLIVRNSVTGVVEKVSSSSLVGSIPTQADKHLTPIAGTNGNGIMTNLTITYTPSADGYVEVLVNGIGIYLGTSSSVGDGYFAAPGTGGTIGRSITNIQAGDEFWWNAVIAGFTIDTSDKIDFIYSV